MTSSPADKTRERLVERLRSPEPIIRERDIRDAADMLETDARLLADALAGLKPFGDAHEELKRGNKYYTEIKPDDLAIARALVTRIEAALAKEPS